MRLLLDRNADVMAKDNDGWKALQSAARNGHEGVVRLLLDQNADISAEGPTG